MRLGLRVAAVAIALGGFLDPALARRVRVPLTVEILLPAPSHPEFARAETLSNEIRSTLGDRVSVGDASRPAAIVTIGESSLPEVPSAPVFAVPLAPVRPSTAILNVRVPDRSAVGQSAPVDVTLRAAGLEGRRTTVALELRGTTVATVDHQWTHDDETFEGRLVFVPPMMGVHRVRVIARTAGLGISTVADTLVVAQDRRLRVLAYEPRPTWSLTFVRRSLEEDPLFEVASRSRTSRNVAMSSASAPVVAALDADRFDAILVGALDALEHTELGALDRFVAVRGGTLILLPDRSLPGSVRHRFSLPLAEEVLVETPVRLEGAASLRASELLLMPALEDRLKSLASVKQGSADKPVIVVAQHGSGRIVLSGALDAWRYRADESAAFDSFWRALAADSALAAPPRIAVSVSPAIARTSDTLVISVQVRDTEFESRAASVAVPAVRASLSGSATEPVRLWPGPRPGSYEGRVKAPATGRYVVSAFTEGASAETPLVIAGDVVHPMQETGAASYAARTTNGAVVKTPAALAAALTALETDAVEQVQRPMRSPWWIVPFSLLLCTEWGLRRRAGLK